MLKYILPFFILFFSLAASAQNTFELDPAQSMLMTGKGPGQDAVNNPFSGEDCIALVDNIGKKPFSVRIQSKGEIIEIIPIKPKTTKRIEFKKAYELYLDTDYKTKARVQFQKKMSN